MKWSDYPQGRIIKAARLLEEGLMHLQSEEFAEAEDTIKRALKQCPIPAIINNLAVVYLQTGRFEEALAQLEPNLLGNAPAPYAHAIAARCLLGLGRRKEAAVAAQTAVRHFNAGRPTEEDRLRRPEEARWYGNAVPIFKALGDLGEHQRVWDLYQDWQAGIREPHAHYYAGIAAFNLGHLARAESAWRQAKERDRDSWQFLQHFCLVARLCRDEGLPVPVLNYETPSMAFDEIPGTTGTYEDWEPTVRWFLAHPANLMVQLSLMLTGAQAMQGGDTAMQHLVRYGDEWGEEFGRCLLRSAGVPDSLKLAAASGLIDRGVFDPLEPIEVVVDGELREVVLQKVAVEISTEATPEIEAQYDALCSRFDQGELEPVIEELEELIYDGEGPIWASLAIMYASALWRTEEFDVAEIWFDILSTQLPGSPQVLLNFAQMRLDQERYDEVEQILDELDLSGQPPEAIEEIEEIRDRMLYQAEMLDLPRVLASAYENEKREQAESKTLHPSRTTLKGALGKLPVQWLDAACSLHDLSGLGSRRREREEQLADAMIQDPGGALLNLASFDPEGFDEAVDLLTFVLDEGGWVQKMRVTRHFGTDEDDGFFWGEDPPISTLGLVRMAGLVFVGRTRMDGRACKVVGIPFDFRDALQEALDEM